MTEVKSLDQLTLLLGYIVPGLIIVWMRAQFLMGRIGAVKDSLLIYFTLSLTYLVVLNALTTLCTGNPAPLDQQTRYWLAIDLAGAAVFGAIFGLNARFGWIRQAVGKLGVNLTHVIGPAWEWKFSNFPPSIVFLTLKDDSRICGWCGRKSFVGSDPDDRDLFLEQVYDVDSDGVAHIRVPGKGIYVAAGEIRFIEFVPTPTN